MKAIYLGNKPVGRDCLEWLYESRQTLGLDIDSVYTKASDPKGDLTEFCRTYGLPCHHSLDALEKSDGADLLISVQYHQILKPVHLAKARALAVNLHMAPLPEYRGCNQFSLAIINGDAEFGVTLHRMDPGIDAGPIIDEIRFPIPSDATVARLFATAEERSLELFKRCLPTLVKGEYRLVPQSEYAATRKSGFHLRKEIEAYKRIDLSWSEEKIDRYLRALTMPGFEPPHAIIAGRKTYLTLADEHLAQPNSNLARQ